MIDVLVPKAERDKVTVEMFEENTPYELKLELHNGDFLLSDDERERLMMLCLFNTGLKRFVEILPDESKEILREILSKQR